MALAWKVKVEEVQCKLLKVAVQFCYRVMTAGIAKAILV
jgi:hypothetical protein